MRNPGDAFHIAIPARDLDEAVEYYRGGLGAKLARRYDDRVTFDFFGDQLVCHLSDDLAPEVKVYPRHFGVTFAEEDDFERVVRVITHRSLTVLSDVAVRFPGTAEEHRTILSVDPSNNVIEFKHYVDPRLMY
jgi:extradiol dioxygenase family protein